MISQYTCQGGLSYLASRATKGDHVTFKQGSAHTELKPSACLDMARRNIRASIMPRHASRSSCGCAGRVRVAKLVPRPLC
eukprot:2751686-Pleurochrysis_carterae.AAC.7